MPAPILSGFCAPGASGLASAGFVVQGLGTDDFISQGLEFAESAQESMAAPTGYLVQGLGTPMLVSQGFGAAVQPYAEPLVEWATFFPHVLPWVKGCPDPVVIDHCIKAARVFCAKTRAWHVRALAGPLRRGRTRYGLPFSEDLADRVKLNGATTRGRCQSTEFPTSDPASAGEAARRGSQAREVSLEDARHFTIHGAETGDELALDLVLKPSLQAAGLPAQLSGYVDDIAHGAIATLCLLPRQEWSDVGVAAAQQALFAERCSATGFNVGQGFQAHRRRRGSRLL